MSQVQSSKAKAQKENTRESSKDLEKANGSKAASKNVVKSFKPTQPPPEPSRLTPALIQECKTKLLQFKADLLNQAKEVRSDLTSDDKGGDEADQTVRVLAEAEFLSRHERLRSQLLEIEAALARIESGAFGTCEETEEPIEPERLKAIPWTRLSIEGAEIRESVNKRFAR